MTNSVRRRTSKWDLKEDTHHFPTETRQDNAVPEKVGVSIHDKESKSEWNSSKGAGSHDPKWSDVEANSAVKSKGNSEWSNREPLPENRSEQKDENISRDCYEVTQTWDGDQSYSMSMSPGLDVWREQNHSRSPNSSWSRSRRSRSRSQDHGFRRELEGWNDRIRSGSGVSAPQCNDFAAGRCRRGSQCKFLHQDNHDYEGSRHSGSGPAENWGSRHEREGSSGHANIKEQRDYSRDKISRGYGNYYDGEREKHAVTRNNRSAVRCNDFLKGKCYRGSSCKYAHHGALADGHGTRERVHSRRDINVSFGHDHRREFHRSNDTPCKFFASGNCRNGEYCRFSHDDAPLGSPEGRPRDDRWGHKLGNENRLWEGPKRSDKEADSAHGGAEGRSLDDRCNNENSLWGGPKWSDKAADSDLTKSLRWKNDKDVGKVVVPESRTTERSLVDRWGHSLDNESKTWGGPTRSDKPADQDAHKSPQWISDNNGASMGVPELRGGPKLLNATNMPSAGGNLHFIDKEDTGHNHQNSPSKNPNDITLPTCEQNITREVSGQQHAATVITQPRVSENTYIQHHASLTGAAAAFSCDDSNAVNRSAKPQNEIDFSANILPTMIPMPGQSFNQKGQNIAPQPLSSFNMNAVNGQSQQILLPLASSGQSFSLNGQVQSSQPSSNPQHQTVTYQEDPINKPDMVDPKMSHLTSGPSMSQNVVTNEKVNQITNLSASLAQIFGNSQQLPQLYAALNPSNDMGLMPSQPKSAGAVAPLGETLVQSNQATWSQKQYDPISDSLSKSDISIDPPGFSVNPIEQNKTADGESQISLKSIPQSALTGEPSVGDAPKIVGLEEKLHHESHELKQVEPVVDSEANKVNERAANHIKKEQETTHSEDMDADGLVNEDGKKIKDSKGVRMFKFALAEFVKEILKPTWKEGQMSKEAHKTIVKKVIDKVTGTIQGAHIPQTQEKIDHYLSYSKPRLTKLVQAYVEKYLKS